MKRSEVERVRTFDDLCLLARRLGYKDGPEQLLLTNGASVTNLIDFLEDNPGAIEALVDWVLEEGSTRDGDPIDGDDGDDACPSCGSPDAERDDGTAACVSCGKLWDEDGEAEDD